MNPQTIDLQHYRDFEQLELMARQVVEGFITGLHKSPFHGFSVEFSEHRIYNPGENIRHIDWKLYARTDRLYVKRYEEETNLRCRMVLDASGSMFYPTERLQNVEQPNKILFSTIAILALMNLLRRQRDAVALDIFGPQEHHTAVGSTYAHMRNCSTELYKMLQAYEVGKPLASGNLIEQLHVLAEKAERRSLLMIFSDLYEAQENPEAFFDALKHLRHGKHELVIFWTTDHQEELNLDLPAGPYRFVDMETGAQLKLNPEEIKEAYRQKTAAFRADLERKCLQYKVDLVSADVRKGYREILQAYLIKRKKLF